MTKRDLRHRLTGVAILLFGAGGSTLLHRQVWEAHAKGPASALEGALGLLTFALGSLGLLLVINGARLRDGWKRDCDRAMRRRTRHIRPRPRTNQSETRHPFIAAAAMDPMHYAGGRAALAAFLVMRAHQAALDVRAANVAAKQEPKSPGR
jgi:hypothetical protein